MVFDTNLAFQWLGLSYGHFDGKQFVKDPFKFALLKFYFKFWSLYIALNMSRCFALAIIPRDTIWGLYLCDFANLNRSVYYRTLLLVGPLFNAWFYGNLKIFHRIYFHSKDQYWLRFLQIPKSKTVNDIQIDGYSSQRLADFWKSSSYLQNLLLKSLTIGGAGTMVLVGLAYLVPHLKYLDLFPPLIFWSIVVGNILFLIILGSANLAAVIGTMIYLYLICRLLIERFDLVAHRLRRLAVAKKLDVPEVQKTTAIFEQIVNDLQKSDHFFAKFNLTNYYFGVSICSMTLVNGE